MELIAYISIAWWLVYFEPLQATLHSVYMSLHSRPWVMYLFNALSCIKCMAFWVTLLGSFDFILACEAALGAYILELCLNKLS
jgi:hypothetical protein